MRGDLHRCHATSCDAMVPRHLLMCKAHWRMVPKLLRAEIYINHRTSMKREWLASIEAARAAVAEQEARALSADILGKTLDGRAN